MLYHVAWHESGDVGPDPGVWTESEPTAQGIAWAMGVAGHSRIGITAYDVDWAVPNEPSQLNLGKVVDLLNGQLAGTRVALIPVVKVTEAWAGGERE